MPSHERQELMVKHLLNKGREINYLPSGFNALRGKKPLYFEAAIFERKDTAGNLSICGK